MLLSLSSCNICKLSIWTHTHKKINTSSLQCIFRLKITFYSNGCPCQILSADGTDARMFLKRMATLPVGFTHAGEAAATPCSSCFSETNPSQPQGQCSLWTAGRKRGTKWTRKPQKAEDKHDRMAAERVSNECICGASSSMMPQRWARVCFNSVDSNKHWEGTSRKKMVFFDSLEAKSVKVNSVLYKLLVLNFSHKWH